MKLAKTSGRRHSIQPQKMRTEWLLLCLLLCCACSWRTHFQRSKRVQLNAVTNIVERQKPIKNHAVFSKDCAVCGLHFKRYNDYNKHMLGKRHADMLARVTPVDEIFAEFQQNASTWAINSTIDMVKDVFHLEELYHLNFKRRNSTLHPSQVIGDLQNYEKGRVFRYIRDAMGVGYYNEMATIMHAVDTSIDGHIRVKELFETFESYKKIEKHIIATNKTMQATSPTSKLERIIDIGSGHGLLGVLLAYRFPQLSVYCCDLQQRPTFTAFLNAFEAHGYKVQNRTKVLSNIEFIEDDFKAASHLMTESTMVVAIHGCNSLTEHAIELAIEKRSKWLVIPCCIQKGQYLQSETIFIDDDQARYLLLCGSLAERYKANALYSIDSIITNRNIIIAGNVYPDSRHLVNAVKRNNLPKLAFH